MKATAEIPLFRGDTVFEILERCNGYYERAQGGPLVGYAGRYQAQDGSQKQYVGEIYANFAKAEPYQHVMREYADLMYERHSPAIGELSAFVAAPTGGYTFSDKLGDRFDCRSIKAEKKVVALATSDSREQTELVFARHQLSKGDQVGIVEDVCNNFSTTDQLIDLVERNGGEVCVILCQLNRSPTVDAYYTHPHLAKVQIPVLCLVRKVIPEYRQDDPFVAADVAAGNVVWKPKDEWEKLKKAA